MDGFQCSTCYKSFGRQEHLKRHELSHQEARFHCSKCSKAFYRGDALKKHQRTHFSNTPSLLRRGARACLPCAASKSRCTGESACGRCRSKKLVCQYPTSDGRVARDDLSTSQVQTQFPSNDSQLLPLPSSADQQLYDFAASPAELQPAQHNFDVNSLARAQNASQADTTDAATEQPVYDYQDRVAHLSTGSQASVSHMSAPTNMLSTINWLQMDSMSFEDDDFQSLFPFPFDNFTIPPSIGFASSLGEDDSRQRADESLSDVRDLATHRQSASEVARSPTFQNFHESGDSPLPGSIDSAEGATVASGEYYVDGDAGRLPRSRRRNTVLASRRHPKPIKEVHFSLEITSPICTTSEPRFQISGEMYEQLSRLHSHLCLETATFTTFRSPAFPSKPSLEGFLSLYFSCFDQTMPFLHAVSFRAEATHGALLLAMMSIGSCYLEDGESETLSLSMHEFVRRYLIARTEQRYWPPEDPRTLAQVHLLHVIGAGFTLHDHLRKSASNSLNQASKFCRDEWVVYLRSDVPPGGTISHGSALWLRNEEMRRTGFCIWLLDCIWAFSFQETPRLTLDVASAVHLPCTEEAWSAHNVSDDSPCDTLGTPTLLVALQNLYIDKRLLPNLGEFSHILLIHGLIHRTWEVRTTVTQSLSTFEPSTQKQASSELQPKTPIWPPSIMFFNKWRNSACDCLDILHWKANAVIGAASGIEHPTVLHLHLARVILLSPVKEIVLFSHYLIRANKDPYQLFRSTSSSEAEDHRRAIQRWASHDQYKARLAAIHAGVVLWHIRMYAVNAFYEPMAAAFATLLLWALGVFATKRSDVRNQNSQRPSPPPSYCDIILIDRPTDDELVQQFVRQGYDMHTNITGVGNLFGPEGPRKVLVEGQKLLDNSKTWRGIANYWMRVFSRLETVTASLRMDTDAVNMPTQV